MMLKAEYEEATKTTILRIRKGILVEMSNGEWQFYDETEECYKQMKEAWIKA